MNKNKTVGGCLTVGLISLIVAAIGLGILTLLGALAFSAGVSWLAGGNFSDGWSTAWSKPWVLVGWSVLFFGILAGVGRSSK